MQDLINALKIFAKYTDNQFPTSCDFEVLYVHVEVKKVGEIDRGYLEAYGFTPNTRVDKDEDRAAYEAAIASGCNFLSYKYGSC